MIRIALAFLLCMSAFLVVSCGGSGGAPTEQNGGEVLRGVWTATLDDRAQREVVAEITISEGIITGFLRLIEDGKSYTGPVTGTYSAPRIQFTAQLVGQEPFTFETDKPLLPGGELEGTYRFRANDHGRAVLRKDGTDSPNVAGAWAGRFESSEAEAIHGTWNAEISQTGHQLQGRGVLHHEGHDYTVNLAGSIVGRHLDLAAAIEGDKATLWRGHISREGEILQLRGRYLGRMTPGEGPDAGVLNGARGGHESGAITIRPAELTLPPGGIETLHASRGNIEWSQTSEDAQPGEFLDLREASARFSTSLIGGRITVKATAKENARLFGISRVLVTGATGRLGEERFHTIRGGAARVSRGEHVSWVIEIPVGDGHIRLQTPITEEPRRFELSQELSTVGYSGPRGTFVANGAEGATGFIRYTRIGHGRISGEFQAQMRHREHGDTLSITSAFDVPISR